MDKFSERIGAWLLKEGNNKKKLAGMLNISVGTLNNKIQGDTEWTWSEVCKLSDAIGCKVSDFR